MKLVSLAMVLWAPALWAQQTGTVPDYLGFYALNIPGFSFQAGAEVNVKYLRITGTLDLSQSTRPLFVSDAHAPIPLSLEQASRLLLAVPSGASFDLAGLAGTALSPQGPEKEFFVVFVAIVGEHQIDLRPKLVAAGAGAQGGPQDGRPGTPPSRP